MPTDIVGDYAMPTIQRTSFALLASVSLLLVIGVAPVAAAEFRAGDRVTK
jgi:hypothetical protein